VSELTKDGTVFSHSGKEPLRFLKNSGMTRRSRLVGDVVQTVSFARRSALGPPSRVFRVRLCSDLHSPRARRAAHSSFTATRADLL
jgi:hypothetical protein